MSTTITVQTRDRAAVVQISTNKRNPQWAQHVHETQVIEPENRRDFVIGDGDYFNVNELPAGVVTLEEPGSPAGSVSTARAAPASDHEVEEAAFQDAHAPEADLADAAEVGPVGDEDLHTAP